ncbi:MAG: DUF4159 domain-containing protein, partial [Candidatus Rokuibacteriota bacterium]
RGRGLGRRRRAGVNVRRAASLAGAFGVMLVASTPVARELSPVAPEREVRGAGNAAGCAPGPMTLGAFDVVGDDFLKAPRGDDGSHHQFYFARGMYSEPWRYGDSWLGDGGPGWSIDYPSADRHMMIVATRLSNLDACEWGQPVSFADPDLRRFPFVYSLEWGRNAELSDAEIVGLRGFLEAGGLLMLDDFWGSREWANVEYQLQRVVQQRAIVDLPKDHVFFRAHYTIDEDIIQVPGYGGGIYGRETSQRDGYEPILKAVFDDEGRIMVLIFGNTDLGDALEHAEDPLYPLRYSTYASELFLNTIMYAMTY